MEAAGWLLKPLKLETTSGYKNQAITGGLQNWLPRLTDNLINQAEFRLDQAESIVAPLRGYDHANETQRQESIRRVIAIFKELKSPGITVQNADLLSNSEKTRNHAEPIKDLTMNIQYLKGVGPKRAKLFQKLGITTVQELLHYYPRDWQDRSQVQAINKVKAGQTAVICGIVRAKGSFNVKRGLNLTKVILEDGSGRIEATWFNQPYMKDRFEAGQTIIAYGKIEFFRGWQIAHPEFEILDDQSDAQLYSGRIVPIYSLTEKLNQRILREMISQVLHGLPDDYPEILPDQAVKELKLMSGKQAIIQIHFPDNNQNLEQARDRLIYEELLLQRIAVSRLRKYYQAGKSQSLAIDGPMLNAFLNELPFQLTQAQEHAKQAILNDLSLIKPMHRLLQGDVGSGKTILAVIAALAAVDSGQQAAVMAPTEILAYQHYTVLKKIIEPLRIRIELLTSGLKAKEKKDVYEQLALGTIRIVVGTQALIQEKVIFDSLAVAIIDEQHRFGVEQRQLLRAKGEQPHVLVMTATPIPRTLALTVYGDLDVTTINELPPGRVPIKTTWLTREKSHLAYQHVSQEVKAGQQAYIIFPLIEESEKLELKALSVEYDRLQKHIFPDYKMGLLHGRLSSEEKDAVMTGFKEGQVQILASTTVVEVGVDVPNATIMVIEDADRFGLAALHQLRGRVGRGRHASACYVIADPKTDEARHRMDIMEKVSDGFKLSEKDLALRGPGEFFGIRQHGLPDLKLADLILDSEKIETAGKIAQAIMDNDPALEKPGSISLKKAYFDIYQNKEKHAQTG